MYKRTELITELSGNKNHASVMEGKDEMPYDAQKDLQEALDLMFISKDTSVANSKFQSRLASRSLSPSLSRE